MLQLFENAIFYYIFSSLNCVLIYILASNYTSKIKSFLSSVVALFWFAYPFAEQNISLALFIVFGAVYFFFLYYNKFKLIKIIPIAILTALLAAVRLDIASFIYGMFFWAIFWAGMADVDGLHLSLKKRAIRGFLHGVFFSLVIIVCYLPATIYFINLNGLSILLEKAVNYFSEIFFNINHNTTTILLTFFHNYANEFDFISILKTMVFALPFVICVISVVLFFSNHKRGIEKANTPVFWKKMLIFNLVANLYTKAIFHADLESIFPAFITSIMLLPHAVTILQNRVLRNTVYTLIITFSLLFIIVI